MLFTNGMLTSDVLRWKCIGAATWAVAIAAIASLGWSLAVSPRLLLSPWALLTNCFSPSAWLKAVALAVALAPAFAAQAAVLRAREPHPTYTHRLLQWPLLAAPAMMLSKLAGRASSVGGAIRTAAFLGLHALSATLLLALHPTSSLPPQGASWALQYSLWLAALYFLHHVYWGQDVLLFPSIQRHRYFRLKQRLPGLAAKAVKLAVLAFLGAAATTLLRARSVATAGADAGIAAGVWPLSLVGSVAALLEGSLCAFCWLGCAAALEVVVSERLRPDSYSSRDVVGAMSACLAGKQGELMQVLALHDTSLLAGDVGKEAARRADIFADESGDRWKPVAAACIAELDALSTAVAAALPQQQKPATPASRGATGRAGAGAASAAGHGGHKWNVLPSAISTKGGLGSSKQQLDALLAVRCAYPRAVLAARALAGFAAASLKEDRYGVLQLTQPGLAEVLLGLLGLLGATQQLMRSAASLAPRQLSLGPWRGNGDLASGPATQQQLDAAAYALQDTLAVSLNRVADVFGNELLKVVAESKGQPAYGSASEAAALLQQLITGQL